MCLVTVVVLAQPESVHTLWDTAIIREETSFFVSEIYVPERTNFHQQLAEPEIDAGTPDVTIVVPAGGNISAAGSPDSVDLNELLANDEDWDEMMSEQSGYGSEARRRSALGMIGNAKSGSLRGDSPMGDTAQQSPISALSPCTPSAIMHSPGWAGGDVPAEFAALSPVCSPELRTPGSGYLSNAFGVDVAFRLSDSLPNLQHPTLSPTCISLFSSFHSQPKIFGQRSESLKDIAVKLREFAVDALE